MKFQALLWLLSIFMKRAARKNPDFQKQLDGKDFAFQIQTADGSSVRAYKIKENHVYSKRSALKNPAFTISFKDGDTGVRILSSKDKNAFMRGIQEKDIVITGDFTLVMWFQGISKYLKPQGKKKK